MLVPILDRRVTATCRESQTRGVFWLESPDENAFAEEDVERLAGFADLVGRVLAGIEAAWPRINRANAEMSKWLLAEVAHRVNNPLRAARTNIDVLLKVDGEGLDEPVRKRLRKIERLLADAAEAITDIYRSGEGNVMCASPLELRPVLEEVIETRRPRAEKLNTSLELRSDQDLPHVLLGPTHARYVLGCFLDNSLEAIAERQEDEGDAPSPGHVEFSLTTGLDRNHIQLVTTDDGCGIPDNMLHQVFRPFISTKSSGGSICDRGIGLAIARRVVEAVEGWAYAENLTAGGVKVVLALPTCAEDAPPMAVRIY